MLLGQRRRRWSNPSFSRIFEIFQLDKTSCHRPTTICILHYYCGDLYSMLSPTERLICRLFFMTSEKIHLVIIMMNTFENYINLCPALKHNWSYLSCCLAMLFKHDKWIACTRHMSSKLTVTCHTHIFPHYSWYVPSPKQTRKTGLMMGERRRGWTNIKPALSQRLVFCKRNMLLYKNNVTSHHIISISMTMRKKINLLQTGLTNCYSLKGWCIYNFKT